jgi:hypothetical protein
VNCDFIFVETCGRLFKSGGKLQERIVREKRRALAGRRRYEKERRKRDAGLKPAATKRGFIARRRFIGGR